MKYKILYLGLQYTQNYAFKLFLNLE